jgi:hypothetical protein
MTSITLDTLDSLTASSARKSESSPSAASAQFKDPYNVAYFLGFVAVLSLPLLPAILTWTKVMGGYSF